MPMVLALQLQLTSAALGSAASGPPPSWLEPTYHFRRAAYHMNDPNGLMWTRDDASGNVTYHMYFQSSDPGQSLGSIWGHTSSPDLVHWQREQRTGMRGSSGGGIALPAGFTPPVELKGAKAVIFSSVPMSPALNPPTGLHLSFSTDAGLLEWTEYRNESSVQTSTNATCVICPELVPSEFRPGYIGDNYAWAESDGTTHNFFVLSGSTRCAEGHPWCSYQGIGGNSTAQAFVFKSTDLLHWEFLSDWDFSHRHDAWPPGVPHTSKTQWPGQRIDTPDTFPLVNVDTKAETQAFVWLNSPGCHTHWMLGAMDNATKQFTATLPASIGCADSGSDFLCQQSLTTPDGSRVSIGWIGAAGVGWDGAQSLPRVITLDGHGLAYAPLQGLESLHQNYHFYRHHTAKAGTTEAWSDISKFGGHMHMMLSPHPQAQSGVVALSLLGGACNITLAWLCDGKPCQKQAKCSGSVVNNSDTSGPGGKLARSAPYPNASITPHWCEEICCADPSCTAWTFADPQPGSSPPTYDCWTRQAGTVLTPSTCCWSGLLEGSGSWMLSVGGALIGAVRPNTQDLRINLPITSAAQAPGSKADSVPCKSSGCNSLPMDAHSINIFTDGALVEVYYNGEVVTQQYAKAASQDVTLTTSGSDALIHMDAWAMAASVTGGPEW